MLNYNLFFESKFMDLIEESIIYFSPKFKSTLKLIDNPIANDVLNIESTDVKPDVTFLDIDKEGYLSFLTMRNAKNAIIKRYPHLFDEPTQCIDTTPNSGLAQSLWDIDVDSNGSNTGISKNSRNLIKIGKLVNKIFPDKYTDKQIEDFVNLFKASVENTKEKVEVVEGDLINYWYDYSKYYDRKGSLGGSCMRTKRGIFEIYTNNPDTCKLVILTESGKLKGRALLWKVLSKKVSGKDDTKLDFEWFMDRQYTVYDSDVNKLVSYAKEKGWAYKTYNNHHNCVSVTYLDKIYDIKMTVKVDPPSNNRYPYMDTFKRFDPSTNILYNDDNNDSGYEGCYILEDTDGSYTEIEGGYYSSYYDERIPEDRSVYSHRLDDYLWIDRAVNVSRGSGGNRGWYPEDYDDIVYSDYYDEYIHSNDAVYSDYLGSSILSDDAISVVTVINSDGSCNRHEEYVDDNSDDFIYNSEVDDMLWYKWCDQQYSKWEDHGGILKELLVKNYKNKWIPDRFAMKAYLVTNPDSELKGIEYLSNLDAYLLGYTIDKEKSIDIDEIEYNMGLHEKGIDYRIYNNGKSIFDQLELDFGEAADEKIEKRKAGISKRMGQISEEKYIV